MRKTGIFLVAALALSVAVLGLFLAARCGAKCNETPPARQEPLTVRNDLPRG